MAAIVATNVKRVSASSMKVKLARSGRSTAHREKARPHCRHYSVVPNRENQNHPLRLLDKVEIVETDRQQLEFSYVDSSGYNFVDLNTYETTAFPNEFVADVKDCMKEDRVSFVHRRLRGVSDSSCHCGIRSHRILRGNQSDTANNPTKPATLETGITVQVLLFVKQGDVIKASTEDGSALQGLN